METQPLPIIGAFVIWPDCVADGRGEFCRTYCEYEFSIRGLETHYVQCNLVVNPIAGTLRGLHYQVPPYEETKLVQCVCGRAFDVLVDIRPASPTCGQWTGIQLVAGEHMLLYVPTGIAHGVMTLEPNTELLYQMSEFYSPASARGIRWDDPDIGIEWPAEPTCISSRDSSLPSFRDVVARREHREACDPCKGGT